MLITPCIKNITLVVAIDPNCLALT